MLWWHNAYLAKTLAFIFGWLGDRLLGDPAGWPHPVIAFGKIATAGDSFFFSSPFSEVDQLTTFGAKWPKRADFTPHHRFPAGWAIHRNSF